MAKTTRRNLLIAGTGVVGGLLMPANWRRSLAGVETSTPATSEQQLDRNAIVARHNPTVRKIDAFSALTVGNESFAFTADITGLQTFPEEYHEQFPLCTTAHWAWHTTPAADGIRAADFRFKQYDVDGRKVGYATDSHGQTALFNWLRQNPHRLHLGRIGLLLKRSDGSPATAGDVTAMEQTLDLWSGTLTSNFDFAGQPVVVRTSCNSDVDALAISIKSPLVRDGRLAVRIAFPYGSPEIDMADWKSVDRHQSKCVIADHRADISRTLDQDRYHASVGWGDGQFVQSGVHEFVLHGAGDWLECVACFSPEPITDPLPTAAGCFASAEAHWSKFWSGGGAIDLSGSSDERAVELERRIVLSQYNTALHCAGPMPPQETGLLFNSWYGKSHLEMHWWHGVHFAAWGRFALLERSLDFYQRILPVAKATAVRQGYAGVRWPKMVGPDGHDSPSPVAPLLIWQQPHPIYYAELCYRQNPNRATLERWSQIVFETAEFMASYALLESNRYVLGPPLKTVSENADTLTTKNPAFELAYWRFGMETAQLWRQRMGLAAEPRWADVLDRLSPLPQQEGLYLMQEGMSDTYSKWNWEHPALVGAYGVQPGAGVDRETMRRTLKKVMDVWQWDRCWGWDFPMAAMTAAKLGEPELAVKALMLESPKNRYLPNGHVYQRPNLTAYLPANGGLLAAVAMMAQRDGGFGHDGKWLVRSEGLIGIL
jgi:hypothetical protein